MLYEDDDIEDGSIIDEQAVYTIATQKVRSIIDELKSKITFFENLREETRQKLHELEKENKNLREKILELEKEKENITISLTEEEMKKELRKQNPWGLTKGDVCYYVNYTKILEDKCPACEGRKLITLGGESFLCPKCKGEGVLEQYGYKVEEKIVDHIGWIYMDTIYSGDYILSLCGGGRDIYKKGGKQYVFKDKEPAEKLCIAINASRDYGSKGGSINA